MNFVLAGHQFRLGPESIRDQHNMPVHIPQTNAMTA
jgi:hypothetical protein